MKPAVKSFEELEVYQLACELDLAIHTVSKNWPKEEMYSLIDQVRRSSRAIGANIAEAWAKRRYPAHFTSKLTDADGELQETKHWLRRALAYGYLDISSATDLIEHAQSIGRKPGRMIGDPSWSSRSQ